MSKIDITKMQEKAAKKAYETAFMQEMRHLVADQARADAEKFLVEFRKTGTYKDAVSASAREAIEKYLHSNKFRDSIKETVIYAMDDDLGNAITEKLSEGIKLSYVEPTPKKTRKKR